MWKRIKGIDEMTIFDKVSLLLLFSVASCSQYGRHPVDNSKHSTADADNVMELENRIEDLSNDIRALSGQVQISLTQMAAIQASLAELSAQINDIRDKVTDLHKITGPIDIEGMDFSKIVELMIESHQETLERYGNLLAQGVGVRDVSERRIRELQKDIDELRKISSSEELKKIFPLPSFLL